LFVFIEEGDEGREREIDNERNSQTVCERIGGNNRFDSSSRAAAAADCVMPFPFCLRVLYRIPRNE